MQKSKLTLNKINTQKNFIEKHWNFDISLSNWDESVNEQSPKYHSDHPQFFYFLFFHIFSFPPEHHPQGNCRLYHYPYQFQPAILIESMLTMFADILYLMHHLLCKLFYKQITATAARDGSRCIFYPSLSCNKYNIYDILYMMVMMIMIIHQVCLLHTVALQIFKPLIQ